LPINNGEGYRFLPLDKRAIFFQEPEVPHVDYYLTDYAKYNDFAFFGDSAICFQNSGIAKLKTPILPDLASPLR